MALLRGSMHSVANPHDSLFKAVFGEPRHAAAHFERFLPAPVAQQLDLAELELRPGSFIDEDLRQRHADLVYEVPFRETAGQGRALVYLLFEHQSTPDRLMPLRLLRYMLRLWDSWLEQNDEALTLPPILPVVLHHGRHGWQAPRAFEELYGAPSAALAAVAEHVPRFRFILNDLSATPDEVLRHGALEAVVRLLLKHYQSGDLPARLTDWTGLLRQVLADETSGLRAVQRVVEYLLQATEVPIDVLGRILSEHVSPTMSEMIQTTADRLRAEAKAEFVVRALEARGVRVPDEERERILRCRDREQLDRWFDRAMVAAAVADLFATDE